MEAGKIYKLYEETYVKFIRAIDHIAYHPTSEKKPRKFRIRKSIPKMKDKRSTDNQEIDSIEDQIKHLTLDDLQMIRDGAQIFEQKVQINLRKKKIRILQRKRRFLISSLILGWKLHENKKAIDSLKQNFLALQIQNILQQGQILELARYLNITYGYVNEN